MDHEDAGSARLGSGCELLAHASFEGEPTTFEAEIAARLKVRVIGQDDGDLAAHVDAGIGVPTELCVDDPVAREHQRRMCERRVARVAERQGRIATERQRPVPFPDRQRERRPGLSIKPDERHVLIPPAMLTRRFQSGCGELSGDVVDRLVFASLARSATQERIGRQGPDIGFDTVGRDRGDDSGGESDERYEHAGILG